MSLLVFLNEIKEAFSVVYGNSIESLKDQEIFNKNEIVNKINKNVNNNNLINNNLENNNINLKPKDKNLNGPHENSNGSTIEVTDNNKNDIVKRNNDKEKIIYNITNNNNTTKINKVQEKHLSITINTNIVTKTNPNIKAKKRKWE